MSLKRYVAAFLIAAATLSSAAMAQAPERLKVVATFSILSDFVRNVGGDRIDLVTLVGPDGDAHVYSPTPTDGRRLAEAKVVFVNGLRFEGWMGRLVKSSGGKAARSRPRKASGRSRKPRLDAATGTARQRRSPCLAERRQCQGLRGEHPGRPRRRRSGQQGDL